MNMKVTIRLQTEETIDAVFANPLRAKKPSYKIVAEHYELIHNCIHTSFTFNLPVHAAQEMNTDIGSFILY